MSSHILAPARAIARRLRQSRNRGFGEKPAFALDESPSILVNIKVQRAPWETDEAFTRRVILSGVAQYMEANGIAGDIMVAMNGLVVKAFAGDPHAGQRYVLTTIVQNEPHEPLQRK